MPEKFDIPRDELYRMLHQEGQSINECAAHFGCTRRTIQKRMQKWGIQLQPRYHDLDTDELIRLYEEEGMTVQQIADLYGVYYNVVWTRITNVAKMRNRARRKGQFLGPDNPLWMGGVHVTPNGYIRIKTGPREDKGLHRIIAEQMLGRPLTDEEVVHHMDCNPGNNAPDNLLVCQDTAEHMRLHAAMRRNPSLDQRAWIQEHRAAQKRAA